MRKSKTRPSWTLPPVTLPPVALLLALVSTLSLAACGDFWRNVPPRPAATDDPAIAATPYPSVNSVPARPQLSYPLQQRREIAEGLVADRANARHAGNALRRENNEPVLADQPTPLPPAPSSRGASATPSQQGGLALAYVEEALARDADNGTLEDFLDRLQQPPIGPGPRSAERASAAAAAKKAQEGRAGRAAATTTPAPSSSNDDVPEAQRQPDEPSQLDEQLQEAAADTASTPIEPAAGSAEAPPDDTIEVVEAPSEVVEMPVEAASGAHVAPAASPATTTEASGVAETASAAARAVPRLPLAILFAADDAAIAVRDTAELEALARANGDAPQLFVVGGGPRPGLAMERARRVAALLVGAGIPAERLVIEMGGESDVVVVYEPDGDTG